MSSDDSDDELLANLLATADDPPVPLKKGCPEKSKKSQDSAKKSQDGTQSQTPSQQPKVDSLKELDLDFDFLDDDFSSNFEEEKPAAKSESASQQPKVNALKELDFNFLEGSSNIEEDKPATKTSDSQKDFGSVLNYHENSSDDEASKYWEEDPYSEGGRQMKDLLKTKAAEKADFEFKKENNLSFSLKNLSNTPKATSNQSKSDSSSLSKSFKPLTPKSDKNSLRVSTSTSAVKTDVYTDPIFHLRIINPVVSSAEMAERMRGRKPVTVSTIKLHIANKSEEDWVIAGVLISKSDTKTSQKGSQYCIWKISDLASDMKAVSVFLFSHAYKNFWKTSMGTVVAILNPSVMESKDFNDVATVSVESAQKLMIMGQSKDLGKCKSVKKNGDPCSAPVNLSKCEYCIYHVKQEYGKFSKRSELQTTGARRAFGPNTEKNNSSFQKRHPEAAPFIAVPAKKNAAMVQRDNDILASLRGGKSPITPRYVSRFKSESVSKIKTTSVEISSSQIRKDSDRLNKMKSTSTFVSSPVASPVTEQKGSFKLNLPPPKLGAGCKGGIIDFSESIPKNLINKAKLSAIEYVKQNGSFKKTNPNKVRPSKDTLAEKGIKRKRDEEEGETIAKEAVSKKIAVKNRFQEMLEKKSAHSDLIEKHENDATEEYFKKLEVKEKMEEKMLTTYKVNCKAVHCLVCKYTAFSSSDLCKKLQHPIRVTDGIKRFFKCGDCGNRTITLERLPTETCKKCASSKWVKTAMMDEKKMALPRAQLCIRGGEEKFIGSMATDANLDLIVPESE